MREERVVLEHHADAALLRRHAALRRRHLAAADGDRVPRRAARARRSGAAASTCPTRNGRPAPRSRPAPRAKRDVVDRGDARRSAASRARRRATRPAARRRAPAPRRPSRDDRPDPFPKEHSSIPRGPKAPPLPFCAARRNESIVRAGQRALDLPQCRHAASRGTAGRLTRASRITGRRPTSTMASAAIGAVLVGAARRLAIEMRRQRLEIERAQEQRRRQLLHAVDEDEERRRAERRPDQRQVDAAAARRSRSRRACGRCGRGERGTFSRPASMPPAEMARKRTA